MKLLLHKRLRMLILASLLVHTVPGALNAQEAQTIILTSRVLKFIDGIPHAMDGYTILDMKIISHKIRSLIFGHLDTQTKTNNKLFIFQLAFSRYSKCITIPSFFCFNYFKKLLKSLYCPFIII